MAAATQQYPPWLTPLPTVVTDSAGIPTTSTTVLYLPLTYYGPSIPLDSDWTYGGLTPPASTSTSTTSAPTSSTPITTTTAIPPSSTPTPTSSSSTSITTSSSSSSTPTPASSSSTSITTSSSSSSTATPSTTTPISVSSSFPSSTSASLTLPSSTSTSSSTSVPAANHLTKGQLIGVIVASILGSIFLFILVLSLYLFCKGRKKRQRDVSFAMVTPIDEDYMVVGEEGRALGEGSPRHSGEEADPFLRRSQVGAAAAQPADTEVGVRPDSGQVPGSLSSNGTSSTNHSGYGVLIDRPTLNLLPGTAEELDHLRQGHILSPDELRRINEESVLPPPDNNNDDPRFRPLPPPPRLVDPEHVQTPLLDRPPFKAQGSRLSQMSTIPDADEPVTVGMARRVRAEDLASRSPPELVRTLADVGPSTSTGFFAGLGAGLANIGRLSWLKNSESNSRRTSRSHSYSPTSHDDVEAAKALLHPQMSESSSSRERNFGTFGKNPDRARPVSTSSISGGSVYHDAYSSLPGTPILGAAKLAPLPRALTPSSPSTADYGRPSRSTMNSSLLPSYDPIETAPTSASTSASMFNHGLPSGMDILDMPAPSAVLPFTSASTSTLSLREKTTTNILGLGTPSFPPGLVLSTQKKSWTDASSTATQVHTPFAVVATHNTGPAVAIDVLEDAPPTAEEGWRSMAAVIQSGPGRRTTLGGYAPAPDIVSEQGSLYSNHGPASLRSSDFTPPSGHFQSFSTDSASSRPSALSAARTMGSGHSAAASGSISSDERKRSHAVSPALSAFGPTLEEPGPSVPLEPPAVHFNDGTMRSRGSESTAVDTLASMELVTTTATEPPGSPTSPLIQFSNAPWAAGLDQDWNPTDI